MADTPFFGIFCLAVMANVGVTMKSSGLWKYVQVKMGWAPLIDSASSSEDTSDPVKDMEHLELAKRYLLVYLLATMSDWLQGPYVYALYSGYGYAQHEIAVLFVAGFGSSKFPQKDSGGNNKQIYATIVG
jgi:Sugar-tranasporters, 12 TM